MAVIVSECAIAAVRIHRLATHEHQLPDAVAGAQVDRVVLGHVFEFESQRPMKARVYPSRVQMLQPHTAHARLDAKEGGDVVGEVTDLDGVGEEELPGT